MSQYLGGTRDNISCQNGYATPYETGMLVLLYRLHLPERAGAAMEKFFCIRKSKLSAIIDTFLSALYEVAYPYFNNMNYHHERIEEYAATVAAKSNGLVEDVWGFVDGTLRPCCRPTVGQRLLFSGHKRHHGIKFQSVVTPDGLVTCLYGPECGNRHDSVLWYDSGLGQQLAALMPSGGERPNFKRTPNKICEFCTGTRRFVCWNTGRGGT
jgi:DDE superfamily endonuclease